MADLQHSRPELATPTPTSPLPHSQEWVRLRDRVCIINSALISLFAITAMLGWHLQRPTLFQVHPNFAPMQYNTAMCFLGTAFALLLAHLRWRNISITLALLTLLLSGLTLIQFVTGTDILGIDALVIDPYIATRTLHPGRMSVMTCICFILSSLALISSGLHQKPWNTYLATAVVSGLVLAVSLLSLSSYLLGLTGSRSWFPISQMSLPTVAGFILLATGILSLTWNQAFSSSDKQNNWLPITVFIGSAAATVLLAGALRKQENQNIRAASFSDATVVLTRLWAELGDRHRSIRRMAQRWAKSGVPLHQQWENDALEYLRDDTGYRFIAWTDADMVFQWAEPADAEERLKGTRARPPSLSKDELLRKLARCADVGTMRLGLTPDELNIVATIYHGEEFGGCIIASIEHDRFFHSTLPKELVRNSHFRIAVNGQSVHHRGGSQPPANPKWITTREFNHHGAEWSITLWPAPRTLSREHSFYWKLVLGLGMMLSLILALATYLAHIAQTKSRQAANRNLRLQTEVAARIRAAKQLEKASAFNTAIVTRSPNIVITTDPEGIITSFNPAAERMLGYKAEEVIGKHSPTLFHDLSEVVRHAGELSRKYGTPIEPGFETFVHEARMDLHSQHDWTYIRKNGSRFPVSLGVTALYNNHKEITGFLSAGIDISALKQAMAELKKTHQKLMEASLQVGRAEVATNILHNVGNVLNSINVTTTILGDKVRQSRITSVAKTADLLQQHDSDLAGFFTTDRRGGELPGFLRKLADHLAKEQRDILAEIGNLNNNIQHIREIVSMQQNHSKVTDISEPVAVSELIDMSVRMHIGTLQRNQITIEIDCNPDLVIHVERHKVLQILINLISNAKHACLATHRNDGHIRISAGISDDRCTIIVEDNGEGIPQENLTRIFSHGFTTKEDGHGFGLHSCSLAAKEMKGSLTAASDGPGRGATFTLILPC